MCCGDSYYRAPRRTPSEVDIVKPTAVPIFFVSSVLTDYRHSCAFFSSPQEEYQTLLPFVVNGLQRAERAYHVLPSRYREEHLEQLGSSLSKGSSESGSHRTA